MNVFRSSCACAIFVCCSILVFSPRLLTGQVAPTGVQSASPTAPSPGGGITSGGAPIETTLFAYRALASDAEAISSEVAHIASTHERKIVIGTATDAASFAQWRAIMGEAILLDQKAADLHTRMGYATSHSNSNDTPYGTSPSLVPILHIVLTHSGSFTQGSRTASFVIVVSNDPTGGPTCSPNCGPVTVTEALPQGFITTSMAGNNWVCNLAGSSCTWSAQLQPGDSPPPITVAVNVPNSGQPGAVINTAVVSGGGALAATGSDSLTITAPAGGGGSHAPFAAAVSGAAPTQVPTPAPATTPTSAFGTAVAALPNLLQLATTLASSFSVSQTLSASQGSMTDAPLMNMVARHLQQAGVEVYIPSIYTPQLLKSGDLSDTYLWTSLTHLDEDRRQLWSDIGTASRLLNQANFITMNPSKYTPQSVEDALLFAGTAQSYITSAQSLAASIDSFQTSLFGGQAAAAPSSPAPAGNANPAGNAAPPGSTTPTNNSAPSGTTPSNASPLTGMQITPQAATGAQFSAGQGGNILPQILGSDLLARQLWNGTAFTATNFDTVTNGVNFLSVHALESGGSQLNKTNFWYGVHIFFSGGAVMTFSLYEARGNSICSGFAYDYRGNVREKNYEHVLHSGPAHDAILNTDFSCPGVPAPAIAIVVGMSEEQVINALGPPDSKHFGVFRYISRHLEIKFEGHRVSAIESK